jgi:hypothetical protein
MASWNGCPRLLQTWFGSGVDIFVTGSNPNTVAAIKATRLRYTPCSRSLKTASTILGPLFC